MKNPDQILERLFRAASEDGATAEMPFGFDTRVLALARTTPPNGMLALLVRRASILALAVIALAAAGLYQSASANDLPDEYTIADSAIQANIGE